MTSPVTVQLFSNDQSLDLTQHNQVAQQSLPTNSSAIPPVLEEGAFLSSTVARSTPKHLVELTPPASSSTAGAEGQHAGSTSEDSGFGEFVDAPSVVNQPASSSSDPATTHSLSASNFDPLSSIPPLNTSLLTEPDAPPATIPHSSSQRPVTSALSSSKPPKTNLVDDILKHEQGGLSLFSDPAFREKKDQQVLPSPPPPPPPKSLWTTSTSGVTTPTQLTFNDHLQISSLTSNIAEKTPNSNPGLDTQTSLSSSSAQGTHPLSSAPSSPGRSSPRPPPKLTTPQILKTASNAADETEIIAKHLGLIDHDYFSGREPAEALSIPVPPVRSRSKSASSPVGSSSRVTPPIGRESDEVLIGEDVGFGIGRRDRRDLQGEWPSVPSQPPLPPIPTQRSLGAQEGNPTPPQPERTPSYGTLSGLWGLWKGASGISEEEAASQSSHSKHQHRHPYHHGYQHEHERPQHSHPHVANVFMSSPQPIETTIVEGQPMAYGRTPNTSPTCKSPPSPPTTTTTTYQVSSTIEGGYTGVHGHSGRPLPRARPSLESVQHKWKVDPSSPSSSPSSNTPLGPPSFHSQASSASHSPERSPSRTRPIKPSEIQHVSITHNSPFAPVAAPPGYYGAGGSAALNTGFGSASYTSTIGSVPSSAVGVGSNPFGTHTFTPIAGAPGFKPDMYDWDKGFSDELERELHGGDRGGSQRDGERGTATHEQAREKDRGRPSERSSSNTKSNKEGNGGGTLLYQTLGSKFGFGGWSSSSSSASPSPSSNNTSRGTARSTAPVQKDVSADQGRPGHLRSVTAPHRLDSSPSSSPALRGQAVGDLIQKKVGGVELKARKGSTTGVLTPGLADILRPYLPPLSRLPRSWTLLYSLDQHGISLNTLYTNCEAPEKQRKTGQPYVGMGGAIVILRDAEADAAKDAPGDGGTKSAFGAFIADGIGRKAKGFYGGGDSFLWKYDAPKNELKVFKSAGRNSYFAICDSEYVAFGGGSTSYGLWFPSSLLTGSSAPCPTFGNEVLCSQPSGSSLNGGSVSQLGKEVEFDCVGLEVWGIGPS